MAAGRQYCRGLYVFEEVWNHEWPWNIPVGGRAGEGFGIRPAAPRGKEEGKLVKKEEGVCA